ncbi:MAG TPA: type II secretion system protein [Halomicronema sp.]
MPSGNLRQKQPVQQPNNTTSGYTLIEILAVVIISSILATIGIISYIGWINRLRVNAAHDRIFQVIRETQSTATQRKITWQASFRQPTPDTIEWAIHPATTTPTQWNLINQPGVIIDTQNTTLFRQASINAWRIQFNHKGHPNGQLGRITLSNTSGENKRCVFISTLIGAIRTAEDSRCLR